MLREDGRRKALISLNPAEGVDTGSLVEKLKSVIDPIALSEGMSVEYGGSYEARESAAARLGFLAVILLGAIFIILVLALKSSLTALLALLNVPLALIGGVAAVRIANPVLSVSSLVGFITVTGFVLRNGILLLQRYDELTKSGEDVKSAIRAGSLERMAPILMTSLTTVLGLVPIILAGNKPGGELLSPLAVVQFGGILGASALNLIVLPSAALLAAKALEWKMAKTSSLILLFLGTSLLSGGCQSYSSSPIDWEEEKSAWMKEEELKFSTLEDVASASLVGNRKLNRLRIESATSENVAKQSGWWEDPEFGADFMRIVNPSSHPYLGGASLSFSIPLSGALKLEEKAAEAYSQAAKDEIMAEENEVASSAKIAALRFVYARKTLEELKNFEENDRIKKAFDTAKELVEAGELKTTDLASAKRRRHERAHKLNEVQTLSEEAESELRKLLGVSPNTKLVFSPELAENCPHSSMPEEKDALYYTRHPQVKTLLSRLDGGEAEFEAEIRRQYPDLKIGPTYSNEEGSDRIGFGAGITLPLWNRNRKGIAKAKGERDGLRAEAITKWREIVEEVAFARRRLKRLLEHKAENPSKSEREANELADAGEIDPLAFIAVK
jgi:outer membrane protein TolC